MPNVDSKGIEHPVRPNSTKTGGLFRQVVGRRSYCGRTACFRLQTWSRNADLPARAVSVSAA